MASFGRLLTAAALAVVTFTISVDGALAETRVALVVGNGAYRNVPALPNPANDAADVAAALKRSGFETILETNLDKAGMDDAAIRFARAARNADVAMLYYSGHALQFGGINYLAPVDAKLTDEADLRRMVRLDDMVADLQQAKNLRILVLDACRDNPLADDLKRSIGRTRSLPLQRGLAKIDTPQGMIVAYATQAGRTAEDGDGRNSPYTAAFLKNIEAQEEIGTIFRRVTADVYEATKHVQLPELSLSLIGEFYLRGAAAITIKPDNQSTTADSGRSEEERAAKVWSFTKDTTSVAVLEDFTRQFGSTAYGSLARARLDELRKSQLALAGPTSVTKPPLGEPSAKEDQSEWVSGTWCSAYPNGRATGDKYVFKVASNDDGGSLEYFQKYKKKWFSYKLRRAGPDRIDWITEDANAQFQLSPNHKMSLLAYKSNFPMSRCD